MVAVGGLDAIDGEARAREPVDVEEHFDRPRVVAAAAGSEQEREREHGEHSGNTADLDHRGYVAGSILGVKVVSSLAACVVWLRRWIGRSSTRWSRRRWTRFG
jgi:hypothetical protein